MNLRLVLFTFVYFRGCVNLTLPYMMSWLGHHVRVKNG